MIKKSLFFSIFVVFTVFSNPIKEKQATIELHQSSKKYQAKDFSHLIGMKGFNDELLLTHFKLYEGYVKNTNLLIAILEEYTDQKKMGYQFQAIKRRFGWEFDGMRMHEYYFENLGGKKALDSKSSFYKLINKNFGSFANWKNDFIETAMIRGVGWSVLYYDSETGRLFNTWINEHELGHLAGGILILAMDVWEHAYMPQYGIDRRQYIDAFFENIDWEVVSKRMQKALQKK